jgi:hypothetical protein
MEFRDRLIPFAPMVPRARSITCVVAVALLAAGVSHMFTFGLAIDHVPWGENPPFIVLLAASTLVAGVGLVLLSIACPRRLHDRVDLVTVANTAALGVGVVSFWLGFLPHSFPMTPHPHANNAAFMAGLLLIPSAVAAAACRARQHRRAESPRAWRLP